MQKGNNLFKLEKEIYNFIHYKDYSPDKFFPTLAKILNSIKFNSEKDSFSDLFERYAPLKERKKLGQFFTHKEIVNLIFDNIPIEKNWKILDPSCGVGAFIIEAIKRTNQLENIYSIDIDRKVLDLCTLNVKISFNLDIPESNYVCKNTLSRKGATGFNFEKVFPKIKKEGGFDLIVGNPPFSNLRKNIDFDPLDPMYKKVISGITNSSTLMIARSYELLKEKGFLAFVMPKNMLRVDSFGGLRRFLIQNTKIISIFDLNHHFKDVRGDQIVLIFQKNKLNKNELKKHLVDIILYKYPKLSFSKQPRYKIKQSEFLKYSFFPVFYSKEMKSIVDNLLSINKNLYDICKGDIFRGISIGSNHKAISKVKLSNSEICLRGDSIERYGIKYNLFIDLTKLSLAELRKISRLKKNKIIIQNIFSKEGGVFGTLDAENNLTLDTVTNIIPHDISKKYVLALLNSKLANFFMIFAVYLNSNFTMHTDSSYIGKIPIIVPDKNVIQDVEKIVDKLIKKQDKYSEDFFKNYNKLNRLFYNIYSISKDEIEVIENLLCEVMSGKQWQKQ